jgi:hypothetical protein
MNCLYIALFFNIIAGIVQTFIKSWNQLLYPRVIEVCRLPFELRHDFFLHLIIIVEIFPAICFFLRHILPINTVTINSNNLFVNFTWAFTFALRNLMKERTSHLAGLWIGAAISNTSHSNKAGSTTVKRARLTGKGSTLTAVLP